MVKRNVTAKKPRENTRGETRSVARKTTVLWGSPKKESTGYTSGRIQEQTEFLMERSVIHGSTESIVYDRGGGPWSPGKLSSGADRWCLPSIKWKSNDGRGRYKERTARRL